MGIVFVRIVCVCNMSDVAWKWLATHMFFVVVFVCVHVALGVIILALRVSLDPILPLFLHRPLQVIGISW